MPTFRLWLCNLLIALILVGCGGSKSTNTGDSSQSPSTGSASAPVAFGERRVGIVYSETSAKNYFDEFTYGQLYTAMQHQTMQAGVPYDLLKESDLVDAAVLSKYGALIIPVMTHVNSALRDQIVNALLAAQDNGLSIITSSGFMTSDENGDSYADANSAMTNVLGVVPSLYLNEVNAQLTVVRNDHPITARYEVDELVDDYSVTWFAEYAPVDPSQATTLVEGTVDNNSHALIQVLERPSRVVHFANDEFLADNNILWSAIRWALYGNTAPVSLLTSRSTGLFIARNDMDQAMIAPELINNEIPLLDIIRDWKRDYNFVSSYYIDIGNEPERGVYTDWSISAPLYAEYLAMDNEFGTHSWTHPHYTSNLSDADLEFEFNQSKQEISTQLGINVIGGAVPGNPEDLNVVENLNQWFEYFSGRSITGTPGYRSGIGFLNPDHDMRYFNLNMTPDFGLIDFQNYTPEQALAIWLEEFDTLQVQAEMPVMHWLWHDYGPTAQAETGRYSVAMFEDTIERAYNAGSEFVTLEDYHNRLTALESTVLSTGVSGEITAKLEGSGLGQFALKVDAGTEISSVANWYAYSKDAVFVPDDGGEFVITPGANAADVTRIVDLPMRARLMSVNGNANELYFSFVGQGNVKIELSDAMLNNFSVSGSDAFAVEQNTLVLSFADSTTHNASVTALNPVNSPPVSNAGSATTSYSSPVDIVLTATDPNEDAINYRLIVEPVSGTLSGTAPNLEYMPNDGFSGIDTFTFIANDGALDSAVSVFTVTVGSPAVANSAPVANKAVYSSVAGIDVDVLLSGADNEGANLQYIVATQPANGVLSGTPPNLVYTPTNGFVGKDEFSYRVSDGVLQSEIVRVVLNVNAQAEPINGTVSNILNDSVNVDAQLSEWNGLLPFSIDPKDIELLNGIDWKQAWMGHDANSLFVAYEQYNEVDINWRNQIYIDTDTNIDTGFIGFNGEYPLGADYLVEGNSVLKYTGSGKQWQWEVLGSISGQSAGNVVELAVPRVLLDNADNMNLFFVSINVDNSTDYYPDDTLNSDAVSYSRQFSYSFNENSNPDNAAPVATPLALNTANNAELPIGLSGYDINNDELGFEVTSQPAKGTLSGTPPNLSYMPNAGYVGSDSFTFVAHDGSLQSNTAVVTLNVVAPPAFDSIPVAHNKSVSLETNATAPITLSGSDYDGGSLVYSVVTPPTNGVLSGEAPQVVYSPNAGYSGADSFTYLVNDGTSNSELAIVQLAIESIEPENVAPVALSQSLVTQFETSLGIVLSGSDADGDGLTYSVVNAPLAGTLSGDGANLTYTPAMRASGIDSFKFIVNDGLVDSAPATVSINIEPYVPVNLPPTAIGQRLDGKNNTPLDIVLNGIDPEQAGLTFQIVDNPTGGTLSGVAPNLVYTPNQNFTGIDQLTFSVNDGFISSEPAIVTINIANDTNVVLSNPVASISIDGDLSDWLGLKQFTSDPDDVSGLQNPLNWLSTMMAHDDDNIYFMFRNDGPFTLSWGHSIRLDVDGDMNTGFRDFNNESPIGADFLIEGNSVHAYTGTGNNWSWDYISTATSALQGEVLEFAIPRSMFGDPENIQFYLRANNEPFGGNIIDLYPDNAHDANTPIVERLLRYSTSP